MTAANTSNMSQILKTIWTQDAIDDVFYSDFPLLAMIPKDTSWTGEARVITVGTNQIGGRSTKFGTAYSRRAPSQVGKMTITTSDNFALWSVDHKLMTLSRNDKGAVVRALERETESAMRKFKRSLGWMLYGNGGGAIGKVSSESGSTITLSDKRAARNFEEDDVVAVWSNNGAMYGSAGTQRGGAGGLLTVSSVNIQAGTVTFDEDVGVTCPGTTSGDYIFPEEDYQNCLYGLDAYISNIASASVGSLWGFTRTGGNRQRKAGVRVGGKGLMVEEAVKKALVQVANNGGEVDHIFMNTEDFYDLEMANQSKKYAMLDEKVGTVGFRSLVFTGHNGKEVKVFPDAECPKNLIYGLKLSDWVLASAGEYPDFLTLNGNKYEMEPAANAAMGRIGGYAQLYCERPGTHFVLDRTLSDADNT